MYFVLPLPSIYLVLQAPSVNQCKYRWLWVSQGYHLPGLWGAVAIQSDIGVICLLEFNHLFLLLEPFSSQICTPKKRLAIKNWLRTRPPWLLVAPLQRVLRWDSKGRNYAAGHTGQFLHHTSFDWEPAGPRLLVLRPHLWPGQGVMETWSPPAVCVTQGITPVASSTGPIEWGYVNLSLMDGIMAQEQVGMETPCCAASFLFNRIKGSTLIKLWPPAPVWY